MTERNFNFSAGPATLPEPVLEQAQAELLSFHGSGMSVMEISHRSDRFERVLEAARDGIRDLLDIPDGYQVLFISGGASLQFSMVPMNFRAEGESADYIVTGYWGKKAAHEARRFGTANLVFSSESGGFRTVPDVETLDFSSDAAYVHYVSNETIDGVEFASDLEAGGIPVICDASSDVLSRPIDVSRYAMIYAGAQKNIGPSGVTLVIVRDDLLERPTQDVYPILDYREYAKSGSMPNTPNTWAIYLVSLVCDWLKHQGGTAAMKERNEAKAGLLYAAIDGSDGFYRGRAERGARSLMNVTFSLPSPDLDRQFCLEAELRGLDGLAGHRTVGGIRASIYNAFPVEGVEALVGFMADFAERHG